MKAPQTPPDKDKQARLIAELRRDQASRQNGYRTQALRILPHICARCGREFDGKRLRELTVHHKDHNFKNNPPDGSNWELLCLYCHDDEHEKYRYQGHVVTADPKDTHSQPVFQPFEDLDQRLKPKPDQADGKTS